MISGEEAAQRERLKYVLSHGSKEGLVENPRQWPGVHAIRPLLEGTPVQGIWFDRTKEYAASPRREEFERMRYATIYLVLLSVLLSPLPCWEGDQSASGSLIPRHPFPQRAESFGFSDHQAPYLGRSVLRL